MLRSQETPTPEILEAAAVAFAEYTAYMDPVLETRRTSGTDDDLVGVLVNAGEGDDRLDHDSLIHETLLILVGGDETTRHVITGGMQALWANPDQLARLRDDPSLLPVAVEEMLRWVTPIKNMARTTTKDADVSGTSIPAGAELLLLYPSGNRDEEVFVDPQTFDITRSPNPHIAFGFGAHFCLGNQLARLELKVMFEQLMSRLPDLALADSDLTRRASNFISGFEKMPVTFTPVPPRAAA
jgi:cytochrome P450 family 142 subfamily A polypeptide 1